MSKADKMLKREGYEPIESPFSDWYAYKNKYTGVVITFMDDVQRLGTKYEASYGLNMLEAVTLKAKELGWGEKAPDNKEKVLDRLSLLKHYAEEAQILGSRESIKEAYNVVLDYVKSID